MAGGFSGKSVLDLGCGRGEMCFFAIKEQAQTVVGLDFSADAIELCENAKDTIEISANQRLDFTQGDALDISFEQEFDIIILGDIVEHLHDQELAKLFKNTEKLLAKDGKIIIHTMPTIEFIKYGQFFKALKSLLCFKPIAIDTFESQRQVTHVNLQTKKHLENLLVHFDYKVWYDFSNTSFVRNIIRKTPFLKFFCSNLWAIARKKT